jgi:hypothetical protein
MSPRIEITFSNIISETRCHASDFGSVLNGAHRTIRSPVDLFTGITWLPLFLLAVVNPFAGSDDRISFLRDIEVHARLLIGLPALIAAELLVHSRMLPVARRFVERHIILPKDLPRFYRAVESASSEPATFSHSRTSATPTPW